MKSLEKMDISLLVHVMNVDEMFDFVNDRIQRPPIYYLSIDDTPPTISGGFVVITVEYITYTKIRQSRESGSYFSE